MIGQLPDSLTIDGVNYKINTHFLVALTILAACEDEDLNDIEKAQVVLQCLYAEPEKIPQNYIEEALEKASWFLDGGQPHSKKNSPKVISWEQDEQILFSAINKVAGFETRNAEYLHWWTFLAYFNEIGEGLFSTVVGIRQQRANGKKLLKHDQEFFNKNKDMVIICSQKEKRKREKERLIIHEKLGL